MNLIAASGLSLICLTFPATYCKLRPQADWVAPLNPVGLLFFEGFMYCNWKHSFAALAKLCFQEPKFVNGNWEKTTYFASILIAPIPKMLWIRQYARFDLV